MSMRRWSSISILSRITSTYRNASNGRGMELRFEDVGHSYGKLQALDGISLTVAAGETLALIGPSGCGKSTLLSIAGGLLRPSRGGVGVTGTAPSGCLNTFTYVFQD